MPTTSLEKLLLAQLKLRVFCRLAVNGLLVLFIVGQVFNIPWILPFVRPVILGSLLVISAITGAVYLLLYYGSNELKVAVRKETFTWAKFMLFTATIWLLTFVVEQRLLND